MPSTRMNIPIPVETTVRKTYKGGNFRPMPSGMARYSKIKVEPTNSIARDGRTPYVVAKSNGSITMRRQGSATIFTIWRALCGKKLSSFY